MPLTVNAKVYNADLYKENLIGYKGPLATVSVKDDIRLSRVAPKATSLFSGVGRANAKLTRTLTLTGAKTPTGDSIFEINGSVPVGAAGADVDIICNDLGSYVSSAAFKTLVKNLLITY